MRAGRGRWAGMVLLSVLLAAGCRSACDPQEVLHRIVFPHEWVGDIDRQMRVSEPSGICWHAQRGTLFVVGDEGDLYEITRDGARIRQKRIRAADLEGVTYDPATGLLYVAVEEAESILEIDPESFAVLREFVLPREFGGRTLLRAGGEGLEGITFIPDSRHPEGGVFWVANQAFTLSDPEDISAVFQVELPLRTRTGAPRITGYFQPGVIDLSGLHYDPVTDHILVISDAINLILEYSRAQRLIRAQAFPGDNQEGLTVDGEDFLYIAQDTGGILKLKWRR